jgi:hypothetical protein
MPTVPVNQSVDVHWRVPAGANLAGVAPGAERIRKFDCLIAAARFAVEMSAEGNEWVQLYLAVGPAMTAEDAFAFLEASKRIASNCRRDCHSAGKIATLSFRMRSEPKASNRLDGRASDDHVI